MKNTNNNINIDDNSATHDLMLIKADKKNLSKLQKSFNNYIEKINILRQEILAVDDQAKYIREKIETHIKPIEDECILKRKEFIAILAHGHETYKLTKAEKEEIGSLICGETLDLITNYGQNDMAELYTTFNGMSYEEEVKQQTEFAREEAKKMYNDRFGGKDKPDFANMSNEDFFDVLQKEEEEEEERRKQAQEKRKENAKSKKKTETQINNEAKKQAEIELTTKSLRSIYMDLVKELHPDKEPDEEKRKHKDEIMKRVTVAYNDKNLYELLRLQIEYKQIDESGLSEVAEERLAIYIKVLQQQAASLRSELSNKIYDYPDEKVVDLGLGGTRQQISYRITTKKKEITKTIEQLENTNSKITNLKEFKAFLKNSIEEGSMANGIGDMFSQLMSAMRSQMNK